MTKARARVAWPCRSAAFPCHFSAPGARRRTKSRALRWEPLAPVAAKVTWPPCVRLRTAYLVTPPPSARRLRFAGGLRSRRPRRGQAQSDAEAKQKDDRPNPGPRAAARRRRRPRRRIGREAERAFDGDPQPASAARPRPRRSTSSSARARAPSARTLTRSSPSEGRLSKALDGRQTRLEELRKAQAPRIWTQLLRDLRRRFQAAGRRRSGSHRGARRSARDGGERGPSFRRGHADLRPAGRDAHANRARLGTAAQPAGARKCSSRRVTTMSR